jgi:DNA anti-recombination protein RmuC
MQAVTEMVNNANEMHQEVLDMTEALTDSDSASSVNPF